VEIAFRPLAAAMKTTRRGARAGCKRSVRVTLRSYSCIYAVGCLDSGEALNAWLYSNGIVEVKGDETNNDEQRIGDSENFVAPPL